MTGTVHERRVPTQAAAVLDIGGSVGAVLVTTGPELVGHEIELLTPQGAVVTHTEVRTRPVAGREVHAGLFPGVEQGAYLLAPGDGRRLALTVTGGEVTTLRC